MPKIKKMCNCLHFINLIIGAESMTENEVTFYKLLLKFKDEKKDKKNKKR